MRPLATEHAPFYRAYIDLVPENEVLPVLEAQLASIRRLTAAVAPERERHAYAPGKWSVRQLVGHLGDGERVFGFRAFCFSHGDRTPLPGFDENAYVDHARSQDRPLADLVDELALLRAANLRLLAPLRDEEWSASGIANDHPITVRALAFVMAGHLRHHFAILRERYGIPLEA